MTTPNKPKLTVVTESPYNVLVIDDDKTWRYKAKLLCAGVAKELGGPLEFYEAESIETGMEILSRENVHVILLDRHLQNESGISVDGIDHIEEILTLKPLAHLLIYTTKDDPRDIVRAIQNGAAGYLLKESDQDLEEYRKQQVRIAMTRAKVMMEREALSRTTPKQNEAFVAKSPAMKRTLSQLDALAEITKPVSFLGHTGCGKGAAARELHRLTAEFLKQTDRPFFNINIATLTEQLAMSELFGHEPNSFTGAGPKRKIGYFELANQGDIFLDEIGEASKELQAKLLKVIEEREFQRVGGSQTLKTSARMIFATNRDLKKMIQEGTFREDLYMRISTFTVELPPLEERKEDIPDLIKCFLSKMNKELSGRPILYEDLPSDFIDHLMRDGVPGNIRGLENDLSRVIVFAPKDKNNRPMLGAWKQVLGIGKKYIPQVKSPTGSLSLEQFLNCPTDFLKPGFPGLSEAKAILERKLVEEAEAKYPSVTGRAKALGMKIANFSRKYSGVRNHKKDKVVNEVVKNEKALPNTESPKWEARFE